MITPSVHKIAPTQFQKKNFFAGTPTIPHIGLISVRTKGMKRANTKALPVPYLLSHFWVAFTFFWLKIRPSGRSKSFTPNLAPIR